MKFPNPPKNRLARLAHSVGKRYAAHHVGLESAALAFYLIFALFPALILISMLLGIFHLDLEETLADLSNLLPREVLWILQSFLRSAARPGVKLVASSLALSLYFPTRAANSLMYSVRKAYHLGAAHAPLVQGVKTFLYTIVLLAAVAVTVVLMTVSNRILAFAVENLGLPAFAAELWAGLRFPLSTVTAYFAIYLLYALAQDGARNWRDLWPGAMGALGGWLAGSWGYALYVNHVARYSLLFGSIGTVVVLLIWLKLTATVLIMGAELNGALIALRRERAQARDGAVQPGAEASTGKGGAAVR